MPYATIILPTHNRPETLPIAVESGLSQSVEDIELMLTLDGATDNVKQVAYSLAAKDNRIRLLDLPKSDYRSGQAREKAIKQAKTDKIFILQDDDIWFKEHIRTLAPYLEKYDMVTSATLASNRSGKLALWPSMYSSEIFRQNCQKYNLKPIYEAHYCFRRSSYYRNGVKWGEQPPPSGHIKHLLNTFCASPGNQFHSQLLPTALSLNSPSRKMMTQQQRADEMLAWRQKLAALGDISEIYSQASLAWPMMQMLYSIPPVSHQSLAGYLQQFGLQLDVRNLAVAHKNQISFKLTSQQLEEVEAVWCLLTHREVDKNQTAQVLTQLIEPFEGHAPPIAKLGDLLIRHYGAGDALKVVSSISTQSNLQSAILNAISAYVLLKKGEFKKSQQYAQTAINLDTDMNQYILLLAGQIAVSSDDKHLARQLFTQASDLDKQWSEPKLALKTLKT